MRVTCLLKDKKVFEDLGFVAESETATTCELEDSEANYAHNSDMPKNIPYFGWHGAGGDYGAMKFCCDGEVLDEAPTDGDGTLIVVWDEKADAPTERSVRHVREYLSARARIKHLLSPDPLISAMAQSLFLVAHPGSGEQPTTAGEKGMTDK
jgi:hypothetical protein